MPSATRQRTLGRWLRTVGACLTMAFVAACLVVFEVAVFGLLAYGALSLGVETAVSLAPSPELGMVVLVLGYTGVGVLVFAAHRVGKRTSREGELVTQLAIYVSVFLVAATMVLTFLAIQRVGLPTWLFVLVLVTLLAAVYPMALVNAARGWSDDEDDPPWAIEDSDPRSTEEDIRAIGAELRGQLDAGADRLGVAGGLVAVALAGAALWAVVVGVRTHAAHDVVMELSVALGVLFTALHLWDVVQAELRETAVLDEFEDEIDPEVEGEDRGALADRVARLAAQADVPRPAVRLLSSPTPTAAVVGYRPSDSTLVVSTGLVDALDDRQLDAVLAHELAHAANYDAAVLTALSFPRAAAHGAFYRYGVNPVVAVLAALVSLTSRFCAAVVARVREYAADDAAVAMAGDPAALASALETLDAELSHRPSNDLRNSSAAAFSIVPPPWEEHPFFDRTRRLIYRGLFGTHPPTERRIDRLRSVEKRRETSS